MVPRTGEALTHRNLPWLLLAAGPVVYVVLVLAGGPVHFPARSECMPRADDSHPIDAVFGHFRERVAAQSRLRRVLELGFKGSQIESDGCGSVKVVVHGVPSLAVGEDLAAEARRVGLVVTLERAADT
jgi:hypothetical protein